MLSSIFSKFRGKPSVIPPEKRPELIVGPGFDMPDIRPDPVDPCFCGSEKFFKSCCGSREEKRPPPFGVFVEENYLSHDDAAELRALADQCEGERLKVIHESSTPDNMVLVEDERRVSDRVQLGEHQERINELVKSAYLELTAKYIGRELAWYELPQMLRYKPGGFYVKHADCENMDPQTYTWSRTVDRDLSLLIYLNDDYKGGALYFEKFNYKLRPKAGMAVLFPSDNRYLHEAQMLTSGERYAIVSWAAVKDVPKIAQKPSDIAIFFDSH